MRVLSGIQPSGKLHIGNYFGMMKPAIELQEQGEAYLFIANYHAMTTVQDADSLRSMTTEVALRQVALVGQAVESSILRRNHLICQAC